MTPRQRAVHPLVWVMFALAAPAATLNLFPTKTAAPAARSAATGTASADAAILAGGDVVRGETAYDSRCGGCHSLDANRVGPMHRGVYGRKAGSVADFEYSDAVRNSGVVWTASTLDRWLSGPETFIPGQKMGFSVSDPAVRADIIKFLEQESARTP